MWVTMLVGWSINNGIVPGMTGDSSITREETASGEKLICMKVPQWEGDDCYELWELQPGLPLIVTPQWEIVAAITPALPRQGFRLVGTRQPANFAPTQVVEKAGNR